MQIVIAFKALTSFLIVETILQRRKALHWKTIRLATCFSILKNHLYCLLSLCQMDLKIQPISSRDHIAKRKVKLVSVIRRKKKFRTANEKPKHRTSIHIGPKRGSAFFVFSNDLSNYTDAISEIRKNELWSSEKMIKKFSNMSYTFVFEPEQHNLEFIMSDAKPYFLETSFTRIKPSLYYLEAIKEFAPNTFKYRYLIVFDEDASGNILDVSFSIIYHGKPPRR